MNFGLNEAQQTLKTSARKFLAAECPMAQVRQWMETPAAHDQALWEKMAAQGWMGLLIPESFGGIGMTMVEMAVLLEEMGRALLPGPYLSTAVLAASALLEGTADAPKQRYLPAIASGGIKATLALVEESASYDPDAVRMHASTSAEGYVLRGRKLFVPDAGVAGVLVCAAQLGDDLALFAIDTAAHGLITRPMTAVDATRPLYEVLFDSVAVPAESLIARSGDARRAIHRTLSAAAAGLAAELTGSMQKILDLSVDYAKTRKQFGRPIGAFQAVQHMCADILFLTESSRSASYFAAWTLGHDPEAAPLACSVAKAYSSDAAREAGNRGIQVHGGMGFTWENDLHLYYRRAKASELAFGDASYHREKIAAAVVDRNLAWPDSPGAA